MANHPNRSRQTRTGHIGDCYEYDAGGRRLVGTDRMTVDGMVGLSEQWPKTYHQYVGTNGYVAWAKAGREIDEAQLPFPI